MPDNDLSYHDRLIARYKRNPVFRFWFWFETRRLKRIQDWRDEVDAAARKAVMDSQPVDLRVLCENCGMEVSVSRTVSVAYGLTCEECWYGDTVWKGQG